MLNMSIEEKVSTSISELEPHDKYGLISLLLGLRKSREIRDKSSTSLNKKIEDDVFIEQLRLISERSSLKSIKNALKYMELGHDYFTKANVKEALINYEESICYMPKKNVYESYLAFMNRIPALFRLRRFEECLYNVECILKLEEFKNEDICELLAHRMMCLIAINDKQQADQAASELEEYMLSSVHIHSDQQLVFIMDQIDKYQNYNIQEKDRISLDKSYVLDNINQENQQTIDKTSEKLPFASNKINLMYSKDYGLGLKADEEINMGEVIIIDDAYTKVTSSENNFSYCNHCVSKIFFLYPCRRCSDVAYCSTKCENLAFNTYHEYECGYSMFFNKYDRAKLALRLITTTPQDSIIEIKKQIDKGFLKINSVINQTINNTYENVCALSTVFNNIKPDLLYFLNKLADILVNMLPSKFFVNLDKMFVGAMLVFHMMQFSTNESELCNSEMVHEIEHGDFNIFQNKKYGVGLFLTTSLMNHSCCPNVVFCNEKNMMVTRCIRKIVPGQQILCSYGQKNYFLRKEADYIDSIQRRYNFTCKCYICVKGDTRKALNQDDLYTLQINDQVLDRMSFSNDVIKDLEYILSSKLSVLKKTNVEIGEVNHRIAMFYLLSKDRDNYYRSLAYSIQNCHIARMRYGDKSLEFSYTIEFIGFVYFQMRYYEDAKIYYREALKLMMPFFGSSNYKIHKLKEVFSKIEAKLTKQQLKE